MQKRFRELRKLRDFLNRTIIKDTITKIKLPLVSNISGHARRFSASVARKFENAEQNLEMQNAHAYFNWKRGTQKHKFVLLSFR